MPRYRVLLDVIDNNGVLTAPQIRGIAEEIASKSVFAPTPEQKRKGVDVQMITRQQATAEPYHSHDANGSYCNGCDYQSRDGLS